MVEKDSDAVQQQEVGDLVNKVSSELELYGSYTLENIYRHAVFLCLMCMCVCVCAYF